MKKHKIKKNIIISIVILLFFICGISIYRNIPVERSFTPSGENVKTIGRTCMIDDSLWLVHSGTGIEFQFRGTSATITLKGDDSVQKSMDRYARYAIYVNGERVIDDLMSESEKTISVFESDKIENCTIKVIKLSEAQFSTMAISKIEVNSIGDIKPTENSEKLIEFIGDSITCGYGVDDTNCANPFATFTEDITKSYAYKTAEYFDADYSMVSFTSFGVLSGLTVNDFIETQKCVPLYYESLGFCENSLDSYFPQNFSWDFTSTREPDLIVINLGTNDDSYTKGEVNKTNDYMDAYVDFLKQIRLQNPSATILCTLGIMKNNLYPATAGAVQQYKDTSGDSNIYTMEFDTQLEEDGYGATYHPSIITHEKASTKLINEICSIMDW